MTNQHILEKAITKAIEGGWRAIYNSVDYTECPKDIGPSDVSWHGKKNTVYTDYPRLVFDHNFAKALWPEEKDGNGRIARSGGVAMEYWQYYLQEMVIAEDPLQYLGNHI